ncbi:HIRAN domain-containing protein [Paeniglutamicibacter sp. R2-26]|uniref:HIRAN domain-containing protein n=1 Tax=Paeniglutamicibacter sp. R2-26 TaxID=3144417 RepID=UPI003EE44760
MRSSREVVPDIDIHQVSRSLWLIWKHPDTGRYSRVGQLDSLSTGEFEFSYEDVTLLPPEFAPLAEFPDVNRQYRGPGLPAFYANRVMSDTRSAYGQYMDWLGLDPNTQNVPIEILARTGGERATDTFHVVERPLSAEEFSSYFFVSGIRYTGFEISSGSVALGDKLRIVPEPENPFNSHAIVLESKRSEKIGWIPDWMLAVFPTSDASNELVITVEKINIDAPHRMQLLCNATWSSL